jgi:hypothetical protein
LILSGSSLAFADPQPAECLRCHGNVEPPADAGGAKPPLLDSAFSMSWLMYETSSAQTPPYTQIPEPHSVSRGRTYYDWSDRSMTEIYRDRCIDIFEGGNDFSCQFLSNHEKTYLIRFALGDLTKPTSCCRWSADPFWAPRPDVLANMHFQQSLKLDGTDTDFWSLDIPIPGPFGYGVAGKRPVAFWFPVIGGWVQQEFSDYVSARPDPGVFEAPRICQGEIPLCR